MRHTHPDPGRAVLCLSADCPCLPPPQGAQVSNPWAPGQRLSSTGVGHPGCVSPLSPSSPNPFAEQQLAGSPMAMGSPLARPPVTTQSPKVPERALLQRSQLDGTSGAAAAGARGADSAAGTSTAVTTAVGGAGDGGGYGGPAAAAAAAAAPLQASTPPVQTVEGAAAVESLMGGRSGASQQQLLDPLPEGSLPSGGLREILGLMSCDAAAAANGVGAGVADFNVFLTSRWGWSVWWWW
jgi:hypothetical protein